MVERPHAVGLTLRVDKLSSRSRSIDEDSPRSSAISETIACALLRARAVVALEPARRSAINRVGVSMAHSIKRNQWDYHATRCGRPTPDQILLLLHGHAGRSDRHSRRTEFGRRC